MLAAGWIVFLTVIAHDVTVNPSVWRMAARTSTVERIMLPRAEGQVPPFPGENQA
jgi:hypothetical protein